MRFVCDSCRAQYMISDEKVGAKGVKVRCKKCGHVILVRRGDTTVFAEAPGPESEVEAQAESGGSAAAEGKKPPSASAIFGGVDDDELGAAFDQALSPGATPSKSSTEDLIASQLGGADEPNDVESTRVMDAAAMKRLAAASEDSQGEVAEEKKPATDEHEWFVAIDEKQTGPLTVAKIKEHWDRGEVTADSLTWRAGFSDWVPMAEVTELAAILAPRPTKPIIVAPAPLSPAAPSAPVESAFSGTAARGTRTEIKPQSGAAPEEPGGWRPTAAHALVSLMKDEMAALQRPTASTARPQASAAATSVPSLLDVPPSAEAGLNGHVPHEPESPRAARTAQHPAMAMAPPPPASTYAAPPPAYVSYRPGASLHGTNRTMLLIGGAIVLILLLFGGSVVYLLSRNGAPAQAPVAEAVPVPPPAPPPVAPSASPAKEAAAPAPAKPTVPAGAVVENTPAPQAVRNVIPARAPEIIPPGAEGGHRGARSGSRHRLTGVVEDPAEKAASAPAPPEPTSDDFDKAFGAPETKKAPVAAAPSRRRETYVPPAPGGGNTLEELGVGDIMQVVNNNKPAIVHCVEEQKRKEPGLTGKLVMHFGISTSGRTNGVAVSPQSAEFKSSYMANCITGLIKTWRFPAHKLQHDPVDFPFTF